MLTKQKDVETKTLIDWFIDSVDGIYTPNTMGINVFVGYQQYITREDNRLDGYILWIYTLLSAEPENWI